MDDSRGAPQALNLDHELRLMHIEERMSALEKEVAVLKPDVNEVLIAQRVTAGVRAALEEHAQVDLSRWTKVGIAAGILGGIVGGAAEILRATGHGG